MKTAKTLTTYLQMLRAPDTVVRPPVAGVAVTELVEPTVDEYRSVYRMVGEPFNWVDRLRMPDADLRSIIHAPLVEIHVLQVSGRPAGFCELDRRVAGEIEVAYFGLASEFIGQGLGKYFLNWTLHHAWTRRPSRVWLHTCDLDHQAAIPNYVKAGLEIYDTKIIEQPLEDAGDDEGAA